MSNLKKIFKRKFEEYFQFPLSLNSLMALVASIMSSFQIEDFIYLYVYVYLTFVETKSLCNFF